MANEQAAKRVVTHLFFLEQWEPLDIWHDHLIIVISAKQLSLFLSQPGYFTNKGPDKTLQVTAKVRQYVSLKRKGPLDIRVPPF